MESSGAAASPYNGRMVSPADPPPAVGHVPVSSPRADLPEDFLAQVDQLVGDTRSSCLWYLRPDYFPRTPGEIERVLRAIANHGDRATFGRARMLLQWLSRFSSGTSATF
jgi:hypothetical protein